MAVKVRTQEWPRAPRFTLEGEVTRPPERIDLGGQHVVEVIVRCGPAEEESVFRCIAFGRSAPNVLKRVRAGMQVIVLCAPLQHRVKSSKGLEFPVTDMRVLNIGESLA